MTKAAMRTGPYQHDETVSEDAGFTGIPTFVCIFSMLFIDHDDVK